LKKDLTEQISKEVSTAKEMNDTAQNTKQSAPMMIMRIGNTTYEVNFHFSKTSKETMTQKVFRLLRHDIQARFC
jgi:hypothetical protein